jgi:hypothetical protein
MYWVLTLGIRTLSHHVLASTNFNFVEQSYGQTKGMAMGPPLFLPFANFRDGFRADDL